ncbi:MAG: histidine kinase [Solirubrobacterales bacterium]|nr:histidine kinase [Solirubrobacterales bacterium]
MIIGVLPWEDAPPPGGGFDARRRALRWAAMSRQGLKPSTRERLIDAGVVLVVAWFTLAQYGSQGWGELKDVAAEPDGLGFALVMAVALPLFWRRRRPWHVLAITVAASLALAALGYGVHIHLGPAVAIFTLAARPDRGPLRPLVTVAVASYVALVAAGSLALDGLAITRSIGLAVLFSGAWLLGDRRRVARQRADEERARQAREQQLTIAEERTRIARELHDSAGHAINTILVQAGAARVLRDRDPQRSAEAVETIEELARETIDDIDRIVGALRDDDPVELAPVPGVGGIPALVDRQRASGFAVELHDEGERGESIPQAVDRAAYRIAQEMLSNAARHGAGGAAMAIERRDDALVLTVTNPVAGERAPRPGGGRGIGGMRERAELLGGTLEAGLEAGAFRARAVLPYDRGQ